MYEMYRPALIAQLDQPHGEAEVVFATANAMYHVTLFSPLRLILPLLLSPLVLLLQRPALFLTHGPILAC